MNNINEILRENFIRNFNMELLASDLMDLIEDTDTTGTVLTNFIKQEFNENFTYGELYDLFNEQLCKADLEDLLNQMGHTFIDLDELPSEEKEKYY